MVGSTPVGRGRPRGAEARLALGTAVALWAAVGCSPPSAPPLRVGLVVWPAYEMAFLARDRGALDDRIELVDSGSPADVVRAFRNGSVDVIAVTLDYALHLRELGRDCRIILVVDFSEGGDSVVLHRERQKGPGLRGARVGVEPSMLGAFVLFRALERLEMSREEIEVVPVDVARQEEAFLAGQLDAVVTYEPTRSKLLGQGHVEIFNSSAIPGEVVDVLVASIDAVRDRPEELRVLVRSWLDSVDAFPSLSDSELVASARREDVTVAELRAAFKQLRLVDLEENRRLLGGATPALAEVGKRVSETLVRARALERELPADAWSRLLSPEFLPGGLP